MKKMGFQKHNTFWSISVSLTTLKVMGLWAPSDVTGYKKFLFHCYGFVVFMFILGSYIICQFVDMIMIWGDIHLMAGTAYLMFTNIAHAMKVVNMVHRRKQIQKVIRDLDEDLSSVTCEAGRKVIRSYERKTMWLMIVYYCLTGVTLVGWATSAGAYQLLVRAWYPYDTTKSPAYEMTFSHQVLALGIAACLNIGQDTLASTLIAQLTCRVKLIKLQLEKLHHDDIGIYEETNSSVTFTPVTKCQRAPEAVVFSRLRHCVLSLQGTMHTASDFQDCFSAVTFAQFFVSLVIICTTALQLAVQNKNMLRFLSMFTYLLNMIYQVFLYCYPGNSLREECLNVGQAVYQSEWYRSSLQLRRSILMIMIRSRRPLVLTAGGYTTLSLQSFMAIVKTSYSFFTVLQQVGEQ